MKRNYSDLTVLSFGGGQDSTFILYKLITNPAYRQRYAPGRLLVIMSDTGNEHPSTYRHIKYCQQLCESNGIEFYFLGDEWCNRSWKGGLQGHYKRYDVIMSKAMRTKSCTDQLKIKPIYRFLSHYVNDNYLNGMFSPRNKQSLKAFATRFGKIRVLLGISAEEAKRRVDKKGDEHLPAYFKLCVERVYPLIDEGLTRKDCQDGIRKLGLPLPYPSNCIWCPFLSKLEIVWLHRNLPDELAELKEREAAKLKKFAHKEKNYGVFGKKTLDQILEEALKEYGSMTDEQLDEYKLSHGHCVGSSF